MRRANHNALVQRATAAQAALEEHRRAQQARLAEARQAEEQYKSLLSRLDPANACAPPPRCSTGLVCCCKRVVCLFTRDFVWWRGAVGCSQRAWIGACVFLVSRQWKLHCRHLCNSLPLSSC